MLALELLADQPTRVIARCDCDRHQGRGVLVTDKPIEPASDPLLELPNVGPEIASALRALGLSSLEAITQADDKALLGVSGISRKTLSAIRKHIAAHSAQGA